MQTSVVWCTRVAVILLLLGVRLGMAEAGPISCLDVGRNHMLIDASHVSACLDAGVGNLTGNPTNDLFLSDAGAFLYSTASKSDDSNPFNVQFTQTNGTGLWSFDPSFWLTHSLGALGFKFGTGNKPDAWFVYELQSEASSGAWTFVNVFQRGGGLSHVNLYGAGNPTVVSEPSTLVLLGTGLTAVGVRRYRRKR